MALLKLGIDYQSIKALTLDESDNLLVAYEELLTPPTTTRKFKVKKP